MTAHSSSEYVHPIVDGPSPMGLMFALFDNQKAQDGQRRTVQFTRSEGHGPEEIEVRVDLVGRVSGTDSGFRVEGDVIGGAPEERFTASLDVVSSDDSGA